MRFCFALALLFALASCDTDNGEHTPAEIQGFAPVYGDITEARIIRSLPARATVNAGKMYTVGNLLFQVEVDSGIHVINYANAANPVKLGFIRSMLCKELAVKNGKIYTNNISDLVVIDISDPANVTEVGRTPGVFPDLALQYPARPANGSQIYFECPDPERGFILGWKPALLNKPKCWR